MGGSVPMRCFLGHGVREDDYCEHRGVWLGSAECQSTSGRDFQDLLGRGLRGVRYIVSDEHAGLRDALSRAFSNSSDRATDPEIQPGSCTGSGELKGVGMRNTA